jgi:hypothetical protein
MPIYRRVPKRGFHSPNRVENQVLNLSDFERLDSSKEINVEYLREIGAVHGLEPKVKILGVGDVAKAYRVRVHAVSKSAREKIEAQGGSVQIVPWGEGKSRASSRSRVAAARSTGKPARVEAEGPALDPDEPDDPVVDDGAPQNEESPSEVTSRES